MENTTDRQQSNQNIIYDQSVILSAFFGALIYQLLSIAFEGGKNLFDYTVCPEKKDYLFSNGRNFL